MKRHRIAVFPGDGIGPEIVREALKILGVVSKETGFSFETKEGLVGGAAYDQSGSPLPEESMRLALGSDAVLLGAVGGIAALANVAPDLCCQLYEAAREGRHDQARELQLRLIPANNAVTSRFGVPGMKQALDWVGYYGGPPRSPLAPLDAAQQATLRGILVEAGILPA